MRTLFHVIFITIIFMIYRSNEKTLRDKENYIINSIKSDQLFFDNFLFLYKHYLLNFRMGKSNHFPVLKAIYIENLNLPAWKLAYHCNISRTVLFDYRNDIIDCFYFCLNNNIIFEEVAFTKG